MYSKLHTCVLQGLDGHIIDLETDLARGLPVFNIVGLPDAAIKESKERVRAAIKNSGYEFPLNRITINLAPANLRKEGSQMDLAIAMGILASAGLVNINNLRDLVLLGELSLDGKINPIDGALPMVLSLRDLKIKKCIIPYDNREECGVVNGIEIIPAKTLNEVIDHINKSKEIQPYIIDLNKVEDNITYDVDYSEMKGQNSLKRVLEIAAAGSHNLLIIGPPGSGKTMAVRRLPTILPQLSFRESLEVTKIYSVAGIMPSKKLIRERPFRSPHHTASEVSLIGGGRIPKPGEVSLAHKGILFLDELTELNKNVLETLRQPLEDGFVNISRINASYTYPSDFMLVASMNPCPCGYFGDSSNNCSCSPREIDRYLGKISYPLLDRIDIHLEVAPVKYEELNTNDLSESSGTIRERVNYAREIQYKRYKESGIYTNSQMTNKDIKKYCKLSKENQSIMENAFKKYNFSARSYNKILKLARTIADLDNKKDIEDIHLLEAIRYRDLNKKYWG